MESLILIFCFFSSISALIFDCTFLRYSDMLYSCVPQISNISDSRRLTNVTGIHFDGKNNRDVDWLEIYDYTDLDFIPQDMTNFFPNLTYLSIWNSGIKTLNGDELHEYRSLKQFGLVHGILENVPRNFFETTPEMEYSHFVNNSIKYVGENPWNSNQHLTWVTFDQNICTNVYSNPPFDELIENLRQNCSDEPEPEPEPEPTCAEGNTNERICTLEEDIEKLWQENVQIKQRLDEIEEVLRQSRPPCSAALATKKASTRVFSKFV